MSNETKQPGQCTNCRADIQLNGLCYRCADALIKERDGLKRQNQAMREALVAIYNHAAHPDTQSNYVCRKASEALSPTAGSDLVTREEHNKLKRENVQLFNQCDQFRAQLDAFSNSITALCLAIDPDSTHGPESAKIAAYATETRKLAAELACSAFSSNAHYRINKANEMKRHLGMPPEPANQGRLSKDEEWSLLANQVVGAEVFPPGVEMLKAQLANATADKEKAEAACAEKDDLLRYIDQHIVDEYLIQGDCDCRLDDTPCGYCASRHAREAIKHALSTDCGKGFVSKDDLIQIRVELESVLCDPQGQPCFFGSDDDRQFVAHALARLQKLTEAK